MAITFNQVPDWTSWENQGANVATADLDGDGSPELMVLRVDHPTPGPNRGFYRVGGKLDASGNVAGWGPWIEVPGWGSADNQGAGIAVADFGPAGRALVVFQVKHNQPGPNQGLFRIGRALDAQGNVTGGWSDWQAVPNWTSWRDQGAAIAIADIDRDGQPDLLVFHIDDFHTDHPQVPNQSFYRVGFQLTPDGAVAHWGDWMPVDWFSWFNQGAGIAVADLNQDGKLEAIIFQIDNPPEENAGFYRVGWNLDAEGQVQDGWGPWTRIDNWNSKEDEGGGLALAALGGGRPKAVVFHVDNPAGLNAGKYAVVDLQLDIDQAATRGVWRLLPYFSEMLPVHAALLHTGKVLFFAGSGNNAFRAGSPKFGDVTRKVFTSVVWDPSKGVFDSQTFAHPATLRRPNGTVVDFFCCGHTFLPDGRLLVAGGTSKYDVNIVNGQMQPAGHGFDGIPDALIFDPDRGQWNAIKPMTRGRWYPTLMGLDDGSVLAAAGLSEQSIADPNTIETNAGSENAAWVKRRDFDLPLYPHLFQLADGRVFFTGGKMDTDGPSTPFHFDPLTPTNAVVIGGLADVNQCNQCASVLMPPADKQRFMILGGGPSDDAAEFRGIATHRVQIVDLSNPAVNPQYQDRAKLNHERMHVNAVILPDRTVIAVGGGVTREASVKTAVVDPQGGREVFEAEIYNPAADSWTITAPATVARLYHSIAILLPDGRVVSAGGNPDKGSSVDWLPPDPLEEMRIEIFSPPYLFKKAERPAIDAAPAEITYGASVTIKTAQATQITTVNLIRPGVTTHSFNGTQRLVDVPFVATLPDQLKASIPGSRTIAPSGWYMLFITDRDGVPSVAHWVHLS
jgi:hypothetical protein